VATIPLWTHGKHLDTCFFLLVSWNVPEQTRHTFSVGGCFVCLVLFLSLYPQVFPQVFTVPFFVSNLHSQTWHVLVCIFMCLSIADVHERSTFISLITNASHFFRQFISLLIVLQSYSPGHLNNLAVVGFFSFISFFQSGNCNV